MRRLLLSVLAVLMLCPLTSAGAAIKHPPVKHHPVHVVHLPDKSAARDRPVSAAPPRVNLNTTAPLSTAQWMLIPYPWNCIVSWETGGGEHTAANLIYAGQYGYFQFMAATWISAGGTGLPTQHTFAYQLRIAESWLAKTSWEQWPNSSLKCHLR